MCDGSGIILSECGVIFVIIVIVNCGIIVVTLCF